MKKVIWRIILGVIVAAIIMSLMNSSGSKAAQTAVECRTLLANGDYEAAKKLMLPSCNKAMNMLLGSNKARTDGIFVCDGEYSLKDIAEGDDGEMTRVTLKVDSGKYRQKECEVYLVEREGEWKVLAVLDVNADPEGGALLGQLMLNFAMAGE